MTQSPPYGYDPATDTLRVSRHDLHRLLLQFRIELERNGGTGRWSHMADYDKSFERLADAVEHARSVAPYSDYRGPDYRMRCKRTRTYEWPDQPPYDGRPADAVRIKGQGSHYAIWQRDGFGRTLCGSRFVREEAKPVTGESDCRECVREHALAAALGTGAR
jgi:hypothetical protein